MADLVGAVRLPEGPQSAAWLADLVQQYPNVLAIDVGEIMRQVQTIIEQVAKAVEFVFLFTLLGGLLVLQAAIAATQDERQFDAAHRAAGGDQQRCLQLSHVVNGA